MNQEIEKKEAIEENSEKGATMVEYVLMASLIGVALIAGITALKTNVSNTFSEIGSAI